MTSDVHTPSPTNPDDSAPTGTRKCPFCAETIRADAVLCRFCNSRLDQAAAAAPAPPTPSRVPASSTTAAAAPPGVLRRLFGRKRTRAGRLASGVLGVALLLGLSYYTQHTTGILCGESLPGLGDVTCEKVAMGDRGDWFDARTSYLQESVAFRRTRTGCDIAGMAAATEGPVTRADYQKCLVPAYDPFANAVQHAEGVGLRLVEYLEPGQCRRELRDWVTVLDNQRELTERFSSGNVELTRGRIAEAELQQWERLERLERQGGDAVVSACDL